MHSIYDTAKQRTSFEFQFANVVLCAEYLRLAGVHLNKIEYTTSSAESGPISDCRFTYLWQLADPDYATKVLHE